MEVLNSKTKTTILFDVIAFLKILQSCVKLILVILNVTMISENKKAYEKIEICLETKTKK